MSFSPISVGEIVKARPRLRAPRSPSSVRELVWPFHYPARVTALFGEDGALLEFLDFDPRGARDTVITPWERSQGYSLRELHTLDCNCGTCDPDDVLHDPRMRIDQLEAALAADADQATTALQDVGYAGRLLVPRADALARGDFLLFPQQHVHEVTDAHGDIRLSLCSGSLVVGAANRFVVFRPEHPAPVCDPSRPKFDAAYSSGLGSEDTTALEQAALVGMAMLGLVSIPAGPVDNAVHEASIPAVVPHGG
ncbi:hypothetical protein [Glycomyces sp. NPDC048151]|uniref:hypothetical protein n=1 Tax=Glycomyces sp. NPDC048151 TaxID=3364002 RepID=UPI003711AB13